MDVKDLMLGDWIEDGYKKAQVTSITCDGIVETTAAISNIEVVDPIPLTEDILVKNWFTYEEDTFLPDTGYWSLSNEDGLLYFTINAFGVKGSGEVAFGYQDIALKYVHQLQHLLRLCGIEKSIIL